MNSNKNKNYNYNTDNNNIYHHNYQSNNYSNNYNNNQQQQVLQPQPLQQLRQQEQQQNNFNGLWHNLYYPSYPFTDPFCYFGFQALQSVLVCSQWASTSQFHSKQYLQEFVEPAVIEQAAYILIALGAFIFIISFLGYCGSIKESRVLLTAYGIFLIIIFTLQVIFCGWDNHLKQNFRLFWYSCVQYTSPMLTTTLRGSSSPPWTSTTQSGRTRMPWPSAGTWSWLIWVAVGWMDMRILEQLNYLYRNQVQRDLVDR